MGAAALSPAISDRQVGSTPTPFGVTSPIPVTTTRSMMDGSATRADAQLRLGTRCVLVDVIDSILNCPDLLGVFVRDIDLERFLECQDQLDQAQRVGAEVVDERRLGLDVLLVDVQLFLDDPFDFGLDVAA